MDDYAIYLDPVQFRGLRTLICRYLRARPGRRRRPRRSGLSLSAMMRLTLLSFRHNLTQRLLAGWFGIHQSTVCRIIAWMRAVFRAVLGSRIARGSDIESIIAGLPAGERPVVVLIDGTLVPVADRFHDRENYSGKHRRIGRNLQIVSDVRGKLLCVGPVQPGRLHDRRALAESGLEPALCQPQLLVHADRGYTGTEFITPVKSSRHHPLTLAERAENREISGIRNAVERAIAHLKILAILRTGIRTRSVDRVTTINEIIEVAVGLCFFRQEWGYS